VPVPKEKQSALNTPINAPLPYEMMMPQPVQSQYPMTAQPMPMPTPQYQQPQQAQSQQKDQKKFDKVLIEILIGVFLLPIPLITLLGIGLIIDGVRRYWRLRRS
jgi:hypothetical protein